MAIWGTRKKTQQKAIYVLSIDGGGMRGILPAIVLQDLSRRMLAKNRTEALSKLFHLVAGSGSGALAALAMSYNVSHPITGVPLYRGLAPIEVVEAYHALGKKVFPPGVFRSIGQAFTGKYSAEYIEEVLKTVFGELKLDEAHTNVLVPAYYTHKGKAQLFSCSGKRDAQVLTGDQEWFIKDIARATIAAPTYFSPAYISGEDGKPQAYLDGSIVANNPALLAYQYAKAMYPEAQEIHILSIGTGIKPSRLTHRQIRDWGYFDWVNPARKVPLIEVHQAAQRSLVDTQLSLMPDAIYYRIETPLELDYVAIDDASPSSLKKLDRLGKALIAKHEQVLNDFVEML